MSANADPTERGSPDMQTDAQTDPVLQAVVEKIDLETPADRREARQAFAKAFLRRIDDDERKELGVDRLYAVASSAFAFADSRDGTEASVRVFVPTSAECGYDAPGTILETNTDDCPFLVDSVHEELAVRELHVRRVLHPVIGTERDLDGRLRTVTSGRGSAHRESLMHFELDRRLDDPERADLQARV
ncbi:MAG: hypothetical protein ACXVQJ_07660, partial [Actinomycetota bacterium]